MIDSGVTEDYLISIGFKKHLNIFYHHGVKMSMILNRGVWSAYNTKQSRGTDVRTREDLDRAIQLAKDMSHLPNYLKTLPSNDNGYLYPDEIF